MKKTLIALLVLALVGGGVAIAASSTNADVPRDDTRADCPGLIKCPLTGEMICADQCPLATGEKADGDVPPCCRGK